MAKTLRIAFDEFTKNKVNLNSEQTKLARKSRDNLISNLKGFPTTVDDFPEIYEDKIIKFGSFSRNTKLRPLDDIDLILTLHGSGATYSESFDRIKIIVPEKSKKLRILCDDGVLNSRKVVNKIRDSLSCIQNYNSADIKRNQEAATLKLKSYDWNFDIVPGFFTSEDSNGNTFYLIPDGNGNWKKTDPRVDQKRATEINQNKNGRILELIRIIKKWNKRINKPVAGSYLMENIILNHCESEVTVLEPIKELSYFFNYLSKNIYNEILDPKGIQGNLNSLSFDEKCKISSVALTTSNKLKEAWSLEEKGESRKAINKVKEIFGEEFPEYY